MSTQNAPAEPLDLEGVINQEDAAASLGDLDFGDDLEVEAPEAPEEEVVDETPEADEPEEEPAEEPADDGEAPAEPEPEPEHEPEPEAPVEPPRDDKGRFTKEPAIPKSRFDQRTAQLRAAERELEAMKARLQEVETAKQRAEREANTLSDEQLQARITEANAALLEGDTEKAAKLQAEVFAAIRQGQSAVDTGSAPIDPNQIAADVRDQLTFEQTLADITSKYPALDENSEAFDEAVSLEAVGFQKMYFDQGYTRAEATAKAADAVAKIHGLEPPAAPAAAPAKASLAQQEQAASRRKKVDAARRAPPAGVGDAGSSSNGSDTIDLDSISVEDWSALPEAVRSRLLGDGI